MITLNTENASNENPCPKQSDSCMWKARTKHQETRIVSSCWFSIFYYSSSGRVILAGRYGVCDFVGWVWNAYGYEWVWTRVWFGRWEMRDGRHAYLIGKYVCIDIYVVRTEYIVSLDVMIFAVYNLSLKLTSEAFSSFLGSEKWFKSYLIDLFHSMDYVSTCQNLQ